MYKSVQRRMLTLLSSPCGVAAALLILLAGAASLLLLLVQDPCEHGQIRSVLRHGELHFCARKDFKDNIGGYDFEDELAYGPIDVVYTWVNGSDPVWLRKKEFWMVKMGISAGASSSGSAGIARFNHTFTDITNTSSTTLASAEHSTHPLAVDGTDSNSSAEVDDRVSSNRYRDSGELRYSLRSLVKHAPWIRRIYVVTDNQIPHWLNLESSRLKIVPHTDIFPNKSHLPVFSSPAIEAHLHRIRGLSERFIYFNDDVFLGSRTLPEDFLLVSGVQRLHLAWDIPKCAPGCSDAWIGDGFCDKACNVSSCNFDYPDCANSTLPGAASGKIVPRVEVMCTRGCPETWLGDKVCDQRCKVEECAFDAGDCGISMLTGTLTGAILTSDNSIHKAFYSPSADISALNDSVGNFNGSIDREVPVAMTVPMGTKAVYFNLSRMLCLSEPAAPCNITGASESFTFLLAEHTEGSPINYAVVVSRHMTLVVLLFFEGQESAPPPPPLPHKAVFRVTGRNAATNTTVTAEFALKIVPDELLLLSTRGYLNETVIGAMEGFAGKCRRSSALSVEGVTLSKRPVATRGGQGFALELRLPRESLENEAVDTVPMDGVTVVHRFVFANGTSVSVGEVPLAAALVAPSRRTFRLRTISSLRADWQSLSLGLFLRAMRDKVESYENIAHSLQSAHYDPREMTVNSPNHVRGSENGSYIIYLFVKMPVEWHDQESQYLHVRTHILSSSGSSSLACFVSSVRWGRPRVAPSSSENATTPYSVNSTATPTTAGGGDSSSRRLQHDLGSAGGNVVSAGVRRRLTDTYASSLIHVNRIYTKMFGADNRKVPAHMPHMIVRSVIDELQAQLPEEWAATSAHRFRSHQDMQFSFAYYHYAMNRNKVVAPDLKGYVRNHIDSSGDGELDSNEFKTLAAIVRGWGDRPSEDYIQSLYNCTAHNATRKGIITSLFYSNESKVATASSVNPTIEEVLNCSMISEGISRNVDWARLNPTHILGSEKDVAFEMVGDNATTTRAQLDSVRARQSKFICINDNIQNSTPELDAMLRDFFTSFFPTPSIFELPPGRSNPTLYLDEYESINRHWSIGLLRSVSAGNFHLLAALAIVIILASTVGYRLLARGGHRRNSCRL